MALQFTVRDDFQCDPIRDTGIEQHAERVIAVLEPAHHRVQSWRSLAPMKKARTTAARIVPAKNAVVAMTAQDIPDLYSKRTRPSMAIDVGGVRKVNNADAIG